MKALEMPCSTLAKDPSALAASISACRNSILALEGSVKVTEGSSGGWETFAWVCSVVVAIGVTAEIVGIVWDYRDDLTAWKRGIVRPPDRPSFVKFFWFEVLATMVVVAGIVGEASASRKLSTVNSQLRSKTSEIRAESDQLLALVTNEVGDVKKSADGIASDEQQIITDLINERSARTQLEKEQQKTARAQEDANKAQLELKQYLDHVASTQQPRNLDAKKFISLLEGKPKAAVRIWYEPKDPEAYTFALQIKIFLGPPRNGDLLGAGWEVSDPEPMPEEGWEVMSSGFKRFDSSDKRPLDVKHGGGLGPSVLILSNDHLQENTGFGLPRATTAAGALAWALNSSADTGGLIGEPYPGLPDNSLIVVIEKKE